MALEVILPANPSGTVVLRGNAGALQVSRWKRLDCSQAHSFIQCACGFTWVLKMANSKFSIAQSSFLSGLLSQSVTEPVKQIPALEAAFPEANGACVEAAALAAVLQQQTDNDRLARVTNADFLAGVMHSVPSGASGLICSKNGDPTEGPWLPKPADQVHGLAGNTNNYLNSASFFLDVDGTYKARKANVAAYQFVMFDDVGSKVPMERMTGTGPSWAIETSPGNFQVGYIFRNPLTDVAEYARLQNAVLAAGLCDPGAVGAVRWARLPVAVNGKEKYKSGAGQRFHCRLRRWHPERCYSVTELVAMLKLDLNAAPAPQVHESADETAETVGVQHERESDPASLAQIKQLLAAIDPDCSRQEWLRVLMAVFHATGGSDEGLALVDEWSSKGLKYKGIQDIEVQWRSFKADVEKPITIGSLIWMARQAGADTNAIMQRSPVVAAGTAKSEPIALSPLARFSLQDSLPDLEKQRVEQRLILGDIVLLGQATMIFAPPNVGKTLILLSLIIQAIKAGRIDPTKLFYINMDDNSSGLVDKVHLSVEFGFHMLADGHLGFRAEDFRLAMEDMIKANTASGVVVVLDTLKKFTNTMSKESSADFARVVRQFSLKGGTVIALHHANKNPGPNGKLKYAGTTDIVDDFDCVYALQAVADQTECQLRVVEFTNEKRRGDVAETAAYSYSIERGLPYSELLTTVQEVDPAQVGPLKQAAELASDAPVITAIAACIAEGINTKMKMSDAGSKRANVSTRVALRVIEQYTGEDLNQHHWRYIVGARGAQVFELLTLPPLPDETAQSPMPSEALVNEPVALPEPAELADGCDVSDLVSALMSAAAIDTCPENDLY